MTRREQGGRRAGLAFLGLLVMTAGALFAGLCGACTVAFSRSSPQAWILALAIGGPFTAAGVATVIAGLILFRESSKRAPRPDPPPAP